MNELLKRFKNPTTEYRGAPFWSWNGDLSPEELTRQVDDMKAHGMGGFFMHSREGLETEYMGSDWLNCIKETVNEARKTNMKAWLYDEDQWPSGFAGGLIAQRGGDDCRAKLLIMEESGSGHFQIDEPDFLAAFIVKLKEDQIEEINEVNEVGTYQLNAAERGLIFKRKITEPSPWFNGDSYGDNLNPESVKQFIKITYEAYKKEVGDQFGKAVPGIFTDEPNVFSHHHPNMNGVPWTDIFPAYFKDKRGYNLLPNLPYLFLNGKKSKKIRHDYWWTVSDLFMEAYTKQLGEWCQEQGFALTGHFLYENEFAKGIRAAGSIMPHYQYMEVPGIDLLGEAIDETLTVKQCSSVANQFGRKKVLSELYGCTGWEFTFEGQKWVGDWQYVLGVNYRCQHLALYSLRGCRKRDYPPSFNYNNTWWKYNKIVEDYFARLSVILSSGNAVRDILLIHPISTAWANFNGQNSKEVDKLGVQFQQFAEVLLGQHRDFDLGDETILAEYGSINNDKFKVKQAEYNIVILPPVETLRESTVNLVNEFLDTGGIVVACKPLPELIEGEKAVSLKNMFTRDNVRIIADNVELEGVLKDLQQREISIRDKSGSEDAAFLYQQRTLDNQQIYFVVNNDRNSTHKVEIEFNHSGKVELWNPLTGKANEIAALQKSNRLIVEDVIGPAGSRVYVIKDEKSIIEEKVIQEEYKHSKYLSNACRFTRTNPNVLTLDYCQYRMGEENWSTEMQVWAVQQAIRKKLEMRPIFTNGIEQRWRWIHEPHKNDGQPVSLKFSFMVEEVPVTPVFLVLEKAEEFDIIFNGEKINNASQDWFLDRSFRKISLDHLKKGKNTIILSCAYENKMEIEDCYLLGDFAVEAKTRQITAEPEKLQIGDWCFQGYFHYAGSIIYQDNLKFNLSDNERVKIYLRHYSAVTVELRINGERAGHIPWISADGLDITEFIKKGDNEIEIEVMGSPRNMLGPLHQKSGHLLRTSADSFRTTEDNYTTDYITQPYGLLEQVEFRIFEN